jgi:hypothetical protein
VGKSRGKCASAMRLRDEKTLLREPYKKDVLLIYYLERGSASMKHESRNNGDKGTIAYP